MSGSALNTSGTNEVKNIILTYRKSIRHKTVHLHWVCYCTIRYDSLSWVYIRWVFHSLDCMVTHWSVLVRVFCEVFIYTISFLLLWTENAAFRVAYLNRKCRTQGCFFELITPPSGLLFLTVNAASMVAFLNRKCRFQGCFFRTENAVFRVAFLNQKCHVQGCYFESIMLPLWLLVWTENAAFRFVFWTVNAASRETKIQPSLLLFLTWNSAPRAAFRKENAASSVAFSTWNFAFGDALLWWTENIAFITPFLNRKCRP